MEGFTRLHLIYTTLWPPSQNHSPLDGQPAHLLIYRAIAGGELTFQKKMQVYTIYSNKVFLISFTSQDASFPGYQPTIQKMIKTFEVCICIQYRA